MTPPSLPALAWSAVGTADGDAVVRDALACVGAFAVTGAPVDPGLLARTRAALARFFALPLDEKRAFAVERCARGWSTLENAREAREQLHFGPEGPERPAPHGSETLAGPNVWPDDDVRVGVTALTHACVEIARALFDVVERASSTAPGTLAGLVARDPYVITKAIRTRASGDGVATGEGERAGVAPHCDLTLLTIAPSTVGSARDDAGGLECLDVDGAWRAAPADATIVIAGEVLSALTRGRVRAAAHRVVAAGERLSIPVFVSPSLDAVVTPAGAPGARAADATHVHRALDDDLDAPFVFGDAERRRKIGGRWCAFCARPAEPPRSVGAPRAPRSAPRQSR